MNSGGGFGQWVGMEVIRCSIMLEHAKTAQAYICSTDYLSGATSGVHGARNSQSNRKPGHHEPPRKAFSVKNNKK